jgi:hypothetical protein
MSVVIACRVIGFFNNCKLRGHCRAYSTYRIASAGDIFEAFLSGIIVHIIAAK